MWHYYVFAYWLLTGLATVAWLCWQEDDDRDFEKLAPLLLLLGCLLVPVFLFMYTPCYAVRWGVRKVKSWRS